MTRLQDHYRFKHYVTLTLNHRHRTERLERYLRWMCREWNLELPADERLASIDLAVLVKRTLRSSRPPHRIALRTQTCDAAGGG